jgi:hypothetical protein
MSTYLELVNLAIAEAGKDQDDLTSVTFASPPDPRMYNRFKRWVNESYKEIQMARNEWEFKTGRASVLVGPAIYVEQGDGDSEPTANNFTDPYIGADTGYSLIAQQTITHSGDWTLGTAKATIYFSIPEDSDASDFKFNEVFSGDAPPGPGTPRTFRSKGWGRYDFSADGQVPDLLEVLVESVSVQTTGGATVQDNDPDVGLRPLVYVPWSTWDDVFDVIAGSRGKPRYVTTAPDGSLEFYPRPDKQYVVHFTYTKTDGTMTLFSDTPANIPARYHDIIAWMAVRKSGMYDRDRTITGRADERIRYYRNSMERNLMPLVAFEPSRFNRE